MKDSMILGKFNPDAKHIQSEEMKAAYSRIDELEFLLYECREYFADRVDAEYSTESASPKGNIEMTMMVSIDELLL